MRTVKIIPLDYRPVGYNPGIDQDSLEPFSNQTLCYQVIKSCEFLAIILAEILGSLKRVVFNAL